MSSDNVKFLTSATDCELLHHGSEADIFRICIENRSSILKWYKSGAAVDFEVLEKVKGFRTKGLYRIQEIGKEGENPYIVYDFIEGLPSSEFSFPVTVALYLLRQVVQTLGELQSRDIHHGDLNPANIMICRDKDALQAVVIDCGIVGPGALAYASPNRFQGKPPSEGSDLFSLGLLLFRWIMGADLLQGRNFDEFASASNGVHPDHITENLYLSSRFAPAELCVLQPLWNAFFLGEKGCLSDGFDELDELLEIALETVSSGEINLQYSLKKFESEDFSEKMRQKVPRGEKTPLPAQIPQFTPKNSTIKLSVLIGGLLILIVMGILISGVLQDPDVDDAGSLVLRKSRSLTSLSEDSEYLSQDSNEIKADSSLLKNLPVPQQEE